MSESEKYTLPRALEIVGDHAGKLRAAGAIVEVSEGKDAIALSLLGGQALKTSDALWAIDTAVGFTAAERCEDLFDAWYSDSGGAVGHARNVLPLVVLAVEAASRYPEGMLSGIERWRWCQKEADEIAEALMKWVVAHEVAKDASR